MKRRLIRTLVISVIGSLVLGLMGGYVLAAKEELTPYDWSRLPDSEKLKYKTVVVRSADWGGAWMEEDKVTKFNEIIHTANYGKIFDMYNKALFELYHPKVKIQSIDFSPWGREGAQNIISGIAGGTCPSMFPTMHGGGPQRWINKGLCADITDLVKNWDQVPYIENSAVKTIWDLMWKDGRCYGILGSSFILANSVPLAFRKDYFKEAGIYNGKGKPGPPENWTWEDFREICKKLTDIKKKRWGYCPYLIPKSMFLMMRELPFFSFGGQPWTLVVPDKSGKYTWRFADTPPTRKTFEFFQEMVKDKSLLIGVEEDSNRNFKAGRTAITPWPASWAISDILFRPHRYSATVTTEEILGLVLPPQGKYGLKIIEIASDPYAFDPTLNKEELKAAFEWMDWNLVGPGKTLLLERSVHLMSLVDEKAFYPWYALDHKGLSYLRIRKVPKGIPSLDEVIPADIVKVLRDAMKVPQVPGESFFGGVSGLLGYSLEEEVRIIYALYQKIALDPNANVEEEIKKTAELLNSTVYNVKMENDRELLKKYYTGLDNFYKENYPEYYKSAEYKEMWENYYKCW